VPAVASSPSPPALPPSGSPAPAPGRPLDAALLAVDLPGTTPWYPSTINTFAQPFAVDLEAERCTGAADCVQVCPRAVLRMDGKRHRVLIERPDACIRFCACIVQRPSDALRFRYPEGRVIPAAVVKRTRMNLLGRRTVEVRE
jgi:NAD-dependent dihydropyrimidine dehydrogenase PreA subunit